MLFLFCLITTILCQTYTIGATHQNNLVTAVPFRATTDLAVNIALEYLNNIPIDVNVKSDTRYGIASNVSLVCGLLFQQGAVGIVGPATVRVKITHK